MSDVGIVLDSSALLALINDETGSQRVGAVIRGAMISAVNLTEVVTRLVDYGESVDLAIADFTEFEIAVIAFDREQAERAAWMRQPTRSAGLSLGDRACLALAHTYGATAVTADRAWAQIADAVGVDIELIR